MSQKVSERALAECRGAMEIGSQMDIDADAVAALEELLRDSFESVLDKDPEKGNARWKADRPKMLMQAAAVGTLASTFCAILNPDAKLVSTHHLMLAFGFVKAGCDLVLNSSKDERVKLMTIYCAGVAAPPAHNMAFWDAVRRM